MLLTAWVKNPTFKMHSASGRFSPPSQLTPLSHLLSASIWITAHSSQRGVHSPSPQPQPGSCLAQSESPSLCEGSPGPVGLAPALSDAFPSGALELSSHVASLWLTLAPGPLHLLLPLPGTSFPQTSARSTPSAPSRLCRNARSSPWHLDKITIGTPRPLTRSYFVSVTNTITCTTLYEL